MSWSYEDCYVTHIPSLTDKIGRGAERRRAKRLGGEGWYIIGGDGEPIRTFAPGPFSTRREAEEALATLKDTR